MMLRDDHSHLEVLDRDACCRLLRASELGRLALVIGGAPEIFPVNYRLDGDRVLIRTAAGTKLRAVGHTRGCFEIDGGDRAHRTGWSVIVKGRLEELTHYDGAAWSRAEAAGVEPWAGGDKPHVLALHLDHVSGRRVGTATAG